MDDHGAQLMQKTDPIDHVLPCDAHLDQGCDIRVLTQSKNATTADANPSSSDFPNGV